MRLSIAVLSFTIFFAVVSARIDPQNLRCLGLFTRAFFSIYLDYKVKLMIVKKFQCAVKHLRNSMQQLKVWKNGKK